MKGPFIIDSGIAGPTLLITAGVHGDEYEPILATQFLVQSLKGHVLKGKVVLVPIVNGSAVVSHTRYGDDGLDLARICPGNPNGSSTEKDAALVSELIAKADYLIDLHTGGKIFDIHPLAGYMLHPLQAVLEVQRAMAIAFGLPVVWGTDHSPNGRTLSVARDHAIPAIYVEFGGGTTARSSIIAAYANGCMGVLSHLKMMHPTVSTNKILEWWTEDNTPQNGYLQSKMQAPADGIFVPAVQLGQPIKKGSHWGDIFDLDTGNKTEVFAEDSGIVLFLRCEAITKQGDSLGGIMPINQHTLR
jgi:predicted deacylase